MALMVLTSTSCPLLRRIDMGGIVSRPKAPAPAPAPEPEKPEATTAQTEAALQRQAQLRARGRGARGLLSEETLGKQTTLGG
jgi:hypothetical protein